MADQTGNRWRWLGIVSLALVGVLAGAGAYTAQRAEALSYLSNDPKACVNCHIMRDVYDSWQKAPHHAAAVCVDCHLPHDFVGKWLAKAENGWNHSKAFTLQNFHEPIRIHPKNAAILEHNCIGCHQNLIGGVLQAQTSYGQAHAEFAADDKGAHLGCVNCHRDVGHGP